MRLTAIEKPRGIFMWMAYRMTRRQFGKVMTPMKVLYPRMPGALRLSYEIQKFEMNGIRLDRELHFLIVTLTAQINGCEFCVDLARALAARESIPAEKLAALAEYADSPVFSARERAAFSYVEEATRYKRVADATFETLRAHFADWEIVEITWLNAVENYYNLINLPLDIGSDGFCDLEAAG